MGPDSINIGISTCLLGENVRYDGGHKLDRFLRDTLGQYVRYVPVCPEVECGMSVPRESLRLVGDPASPRLVGNRSGEDHTERMTRWARMRVRELEKEDLSGFIFKSGSPSSGMERVRVYDRAGMPRKVGVGMFARIFMEHFPLTPVEDEGRLHDAVLREKFIEAIFVCGRWRELLRKGRTKGGLVRFHTEHKMLILSHSPKHAAEMGKLVASPRSVTIGHLFDRYQELLMAALRMTATARKHTNVLMHALGYFKRDLSADEKQELLEIIEEYRAGNLPLIVPVTIINHYVRKYDQEYLKVQYYLHPHPIELKLRNHA